MDVCPIMINTEVSRRDRFAQIAFSHSFLISSEMQEIKLDMKEK